MNKAKAGIVALILIVVIWLYTNSLIGVDKQVRNYYSLLKNELRQNNLPLRLFAISGRRWKIDNYVLTWFGNAVQDSKHKSGQAIDIIVLDINDDGKADAEDVDIVYKILDQKIVKEDGGLGTYKNRKGFLTRQMVHFDCRGEKVRWNR
jgi:uncharacterized protein YcbK (DUF882 family)